MLCILTFVLTQEMLLNNKGVQSANQSLPSPGGQPYSASLNGGSRAMAATATNGASQPNVPVCEFYSMCVSLPVLMCSLHTAYIASHSFIVLSMKHFHQLCAETVDLQKTV